MNEWMNKIESGIKQNDGWKDEWMNEWISLNQVLYKVMLISQLLPSVLYPLSCILFKLNILTKPTTNYTLGWPNYQIILI